RNNTGIEHIDASRCEARHHSRRNELAGHPRIASDDCRSSVTLGACVSTENECGGLSQVQGQLSGDINAGEAPNPVSSKQTCHECGSLPRLTLRVLWCLAGLLQTGLLTFLDTRIAAQEARFLQPRAIM